MTNKESFRALVVTNSDRDDAEQKIDCVLKSIGLDELDPGDVLVRIAYSALNYKDAMAIGGHPGVARKLPLVPGIDAVGAVVHSSSPEFAVDDQVFIADAKFGTAHHGGLAEFARVPASWVHPVPAGMSLAETVAWGTAGFTAAQSVEQLIAHHIEPVAGEILVTGATGGVGIFAVKLLAKLGYQVVAATGKTDKTDWLIENGATEVVTRESVIDQSAAPLVKSRWAGAIDSVGGVTLASILRSTKNHACVTACGLVGGNALELTVYPFILRGVTLCGIDSANISREQRADIWNKIASQWQLDLSDLATEIELPAVPTATDRLLSGEHFGRTRVRMS